MNIISSVELNCQHLFLTFGSCPIPKSPLKSMTNDIYSWKQHHPKNSNMFINCFDIFIMYSKQRLKLAHQTSVDQVEIFHKISIIRNKNKSFEGLKPNILKNFNAAVLKQGYRMHTRHQIEEIIKFMKNFRLLRYLICRLLIPCCITSVNFIKNQTGSFWSALS